MMGWGIVGLVAFSGAVIVGWVFWFAYIPTRSVWWEGRSEKEQDLIDNQRAAAQMMQESCDEYNRRADYTKKWLEGTSSKEG